MHLLAVLMELNLLTSATRFLFNSECLAQKPKEDVKPFSLIGCMQCLRWRMQPNSFLILFFLGNMIQCTLFIVQCKFWPFCKFTNGRR